MSSPKNRRISIELATRDCTLADLPKIEEIEALCFAEDSYSHSVFLALFNERQKSFSVAIVDENLAGYCAMFQQSQFDMVLASIAVHPSFRGLGVGSKLLSEAIQRMRTRPKSNNRRVILQVRADNFVARRLYEKFGFVASRSIENYYGRMNSGIEMILRL